MTSDAESALHELRRRSHEAELRLTAMMEEQRHPDEKTRLHAKACGVGLVVSYIDEALREMERVRG